MPPPGDGAALWHRLTAAERAGRVLGDVAGTVALADFATGTSLDIAPATLAGRAVLLAVRGQLAAALALIELDGIARRIVLMPPGLPPAHVAAVAAIAEIDTVIADPGAPALPVGAVPIVRCAVAPTAASVSADAIDRSATPATEWVLLTSGTTGVPKLVVHTLASLAAAIPGGAAALGHRAVWSTFYDIRRYGGLQIFLRAMLGGGSMVLANADEPVADFLARAGRAGISHISGTPSHWRRALMSAAAQRIRPSYARMSGEIADQAIIDRLRAAYPDADVAHAFATTEAGVGFAVGDGRAGFPARLLGDAGGVELRIVDGSLRLRSPGVAQRYLGAGVSPLADADGFVDTGDIIDERDGRCFFAGRRDGIINVGGLKVHPEEVEAVLNRHPRVRMALVRARRSPITGALVVADIVAEDGAPGGDLADEVAAFCRRELPAHKVPAVIRVVAALEFGAAGKLARHG